MAKGRLAVVFGMAFTVALSAAVNTEAAFIAYICDDSACAGGAPPDVVVIDQGAGDTNPAAGVITAQGVVGGLLTAINVSQSKPAIGSAALPQLDLNFTATGTGDVWFYASDTDYTGIVGLILQIGGTSSGSPISVTSALTGGSTNTNDIPGAPVLASLGPLTGSPFTGSVATGLVGNISTQANLYTGNPYAANPYSLTLGVHVEQNGGTTTGDALVNVPEPTPALLLGVGLFGLGVLMRRRRDP